MKATFTVLLLAAFVSVGFCQDYEPFPYESPEDITVRTGWVDVALDAFVEADPPSDNGDELNLTDGRNRENEGDAFVAWQGISEPLEIIIDLERVEDDLSSFRAFWAMDATGQGGPVADYIDETNVAVSLDGVNYTNLGVAFSEDYSEANVDDYTIRHVVNDLTILEPVSAQFIRFRVENPPSNVMCSEIAVLREVSIPDTAQNIAAGKSYVTNPPGNDGSRPDDGVRLTDGALSVDAGTDTTGWGGLTAEQQISITIDLGKNENNLAAFRAWYNAWETAFVFVVGTVYVDISADGQNFTNIGLVPKLYDHDDDPSFSNVPYLLIPDEPVQARYVRFLTQGSNDNFWDSFASEFEVYQDSVNVGDWQLY